MENNEYFRNNVLNSLVTDNVRAMILDKLDIRFDAPVVVDPETFQPIANAVFTIKHPLTDDVITGTMRFKLEPANAD